MLSKPLSVRLSVLALILVVVLFVLSCSSDVVAPTENTVASETIGSEGGVLAVTSGDGVTARISIPEGALYDEITMTLSADEAAEGELAAFRLEPANQSFYQPLTLRFSLPDGTDPTVWSVYSLTDTTRQLAHVEPIDGDLEITLWNTGYSNELPTGMKTTTFAAPGDTASTKIVIAQLDCDTKLLWLQNYTSRMVAMANDQGGDPDRIVATARLIIETASEIAECDLDGGSSEIIDAADLLGIAYKQRRDGGSTNFNFTDVPLNAITDELDKRLNPMIGLFADCEALGGVEGINNLSGDVTPIIDGFLVAYSQYVRQHGVEIEHEYWRLLWYNLFHIRMKTYELAQSFDIEDQALLTHLDQLAGALYDVYWPKALAICDETGDQSPLVNLLTGGLLSNYHFVPLGQYPSWANMDRDKILNDIQYCGNDVTLKAYDVYGDLQSTHAIGQRDTTTGNHTTTVSLVVPDDGYISLSGMLRDFWCIPPGASSNAVFSRDSLVARVDDTIINTISGPSSETFFTQPWDLMLNEILDASTDDTSATVTISRVGKMCNGIYAGAPSVEELDEMLFEVEINASPAEDDCGGEGEDIEYVERKIVNPHDTLNYFGRIIAVHGNAIIIGQPATSGPGSAFLFNVDTGQLIASLTSGEGQSNSFGTAVSVFGSSAVVGDVSARNYPDSGRSDYWGAVTIFDTNSGQQIHEVFHDNEESPPRQTLGGTVEMDGDIAIMTSGPSPSDSYLANTTVIMLDVTTGQRVGPRLSLGDSYVQDFFGWRLALSGDIAAIGSGGYYDISDTIHIINIITGQQVLEISDFGWSNYPMPFDLSGDILVVGDLNDDENGIGSGAARLFDVNTGQQVAKLVACDGGTYRHFGSAVAISGNWVIVGSPTWREGNPAAAYLFDVSTGQQIATFTASDGEPSDGFGAAVAISGNTVVVGAPYDDPTGAGRSGSVYVFALDEVNKNPAQR